MKIVIGADHRGFDHKQYIISTMSEIEWLDVGAYDKKRSDFPIFAKAACQTILVGDAQLGLLICGSGIGISIAANRYHKIYAALAWNEEVARSSKEHDHANVLVLPSDYVSKKQAISMIRIWLSAEELDDRYQERIDMIEKLG